MKAAELFAGQGQHAAALKRLKTAPQTSVTSSRMHAYSLRLAQVPFLRLCYAPACSMLPSSIKSSALPRSLAMGKLQTC